jgi:glycosyltransferase involved in cell wall biosynthesis
MTCDDPAVSVLLPVRNAAATIDEAVASLLAQTRSDIEVVSVDDGSDDDSPQRLEGWASRDRRIRVLRRPPRGLVPALEEGLRACRAPLVARMDADDVCRPERLALQVAYLAEHPAVGVVGSQVEGRTVAGLPLARGMTRYLDWSNQLCDPAGIARERFIESPLVHPSVVLRRSVLREGSYRDGPFPEDYELWLRLLGRGVAMAKVPKVLLAWREHPARATRRDPRYAQARHRSLKVAALLSGPLRDERPLLFWGAGLEGKPLLRALLARGRRPVAVIDIDPRKVGNRLHGVPVVPKAALSELVSRHPGVLVLVAVGIPEARPGIRDDLAAVGLVEGESYLFLR